MGKKQFIHFLTLKNKLKMLFFIIRQVLLMILNASVTVVFTIYRQIVIKSMENQNEFYFLHGFIENCNSRVTLVAKDGTPQSRKYIVHL